VSEVDHTALTAQATGFSDAYSTVNDTPITNLNILDNDIDRDGLSLKTLDNVVRSRMLMEYLLTRPSPVLSVLILLLIPSKILPPFLPQ